MDPNQARNLFTVINIIFLKEIPIIQNWTIMYNQFLTLFGQNPGTTQGMLQVCNGIETFNLCMFGNMDCMFMGYLANQTDDIVQAYSFQFNFRQHSISRHSCPEESTICTPTSTVVLESIVAQFLLISSKKIVFSALLHEGLTCPQRIMSGYQNTLQACVTTYQSSVTHDPSNGCQ